MHPHATTNGSDSASAVLLIPLMKHMHHPISPDRSSHQIIWSSPLLWMELSYQIFKLSKSNYQIKSNSKSYFPFRLVTTWERRANTRRVQTFYNCSSTRKTFRTRFAVIHLPRETYSSVMDSMVIAIGGYGHTFMHASPSTDFIILVE